MCTISWLVSKNKYTVFFNRDESVLRPIAIPPAIYQTQKETGNVKHIMPVDPQGQGSWIVTNEFGFTFALLNFYQGKLPKGRLRSRGEIVKLAASVTSNDEAENFIDSLDLNRYAPFSLLIFKPDLLRAEEKFPAVDLCRWDGKSLNLEKKSSPHFSSAVEFEKVCKDRLEFYKKEILDKNATELELKYFHLSHFPEKSRYSICMHREEARTVSFSQVEVTLKEINFYYTDGAPCESPLEKSAILALANSNSAFA